MTTAVDDSIMKINKVLFIRLPEVTTLANEMLEELEEMDVYSGIDLDQIEQKLVELSDLYNDLCKDAPDLKLELYKPVLTKAPPIPYSKALCLKFTRLFLNIKAKPTDELNGRAFLVKIRGCLTELRLTFKKFTDEIR